MKLFKSEPGLPPRADLEKALKAAQAEAERATRSLEVLTAARREILLSGDDAEAEKHDAEMAREARARDRANARIEEIEAKLVEVTAAERGAEIADARAAVEAKIATAIDLSKTYEPAAQAIRRFILAIEEANDAINAFGRRYIDEPRPGKPEPIIRGAVTTEKAITSEETVTLWVDPLETLNHGIVAESFYDRITASDRAGGETGLLHHGKNRRVDLSHETFNPATKVIRRKFLKRTYIPKQQAPYFENLTQAVKLPHLSVGMPPIWANPENKSVTHVLAALERGERAVAARPTEQVEYVPLSSKSDAA